METSQDLEHLYVLDENTPKPTVNPTYPRLYGHHNCPFVEKVRLSFAARNHVYQHCEIDLGKKTPWHIKLNGGKVPIYELPDGTLLYESKILMDYAEDAFPDQRYSLLPEDPILRAKLRLAIPLAEQVFSSFYAIFMKKSYDEELFKTAKNRLQQVEDFLAANGNETSSFALGTKNPTQLDIHFYVFLSRFEYIRGTSKHEELFVPIGFDEYKRCKGLIEAIQERPEFKDAITLRIPHQHHFERHNSTPSGEKVQLFLPNVFE